MLYIQLMIEGDLVHQSMPYLNYVCKSYKGLKLIDVLISTRESDVKVANILKNQYVLILQDFRV